MVTVYQKTEQGPNLSNHQWNLNNGNGLLDFLFSRFVVNDISPPYFLCARIFFGTFPTPFKYLMVRPLPFGQLPNTTAKPCAPVVFFC